MRMLVVEDEADLGTLIVQTLRAEGWACDLAPTIAEAELLHQVHDYALIVLDRQLPDGDGLDACRRWRAGGSTAAVLLLTAMNTNEHVVDGLNAGADDHLGKPFDSAVLVARIRALLRRRPAAVRRMITVGELTIDRERRQVTLSGDLISLTPKEFALLEMLALADHAVIDRLVLLEQCWDHAYEPGSNVVDVHVAALRRKLGRGWIETSRGAGYRLTEARR
jgi:DNA-binding response OmpR family regulator